MFVNKPWELEKAEMIDTLCQRYGCLPSALLKEDAGLLRMVRIVALGRAESPAMAGSRPEPDHTVPTMEEELAALSQVTHA